MITVEQGLSILNPFVDSQNRHQYYDRTVDRRKLYSAMMTGDGLTNYLTRFENRENKEEFEIRKLITNQAVTPAVNEAASKFYKTSRYPNIKRDLYYESDVDRINILEEILKQFCFEGDVQEYMEREFDRRSLIDPNSFMVMDFEMFDAAQNQRPAPYSVFIPCDDVVDFEFLPNDELNYLIITRPYSFYDKQGDLVELIDYYCYCGNDIIIYRQYHEDRIFATPHQIVETTGPTEYRWQSVRSLAGQVQAYRLGYIKDPITHYKTVVSPLDNAETVVRDLINDKSEYDQTKRFHVFPQKLQYVSRCKGGGDIMQTCDKGCRPDGSKCTTCGGSGFTSVHTGSSDILTYIMPDTKDDYVMPLSEVIHYAKPDIEIIQHLREDIETGKLNVVRSIFTTETAVKPNGDIKIDKTATETMIKADDLNNILMPFCLHKVKFYKFIIRQCAFFNDIEKGLVIIYEYPKSLRLESVEELQKIFSTMVTSGAPAPLLDDVEHEIITKRFIDDPEALNRYEIWNTHRPFRNRSSADVQYAIGAGSVPKWIEVLWANFEYIKAQFEDDDSFYIKDFKSRAALLKAAAEELKAELEPEPVEGYLGRGGAAAA